MKLFRLLESFSLIKFVFLTICFFLVYFYFNKPKKDFDLTSKQTFSQALKLEVAFFGDTFEHSFASKDVFKLIQAENPNWLIHHGDMQYTGNNVGFEKLIKSYFPEKMFVGVLGNHDKKYGLENYLNTLNKFCLKSDLENDATSSDGNCMVQKRTGNVWCEHKLFTVVGLNIGISSEFDESKEFIISSLQKSKSKWKICSWHFPYKDYILGFRIPGIDMSSPNMLELYQTCRENGAFLIITSHDHYYGRSHLMKTFGRNYKDKYVEPKVIDNIHHYKYEPGSSIISVNGLGGHSVSPIAEHKLKRNFWAVTHPKIYTYEKPPENNTKSKFIDENYTRKPLSKSNLISIDLKSKSNPFGALFCSFTKNIVKCKWKTVNNEIIDQFEVSK